MTEEEKTNEEEKGSEEAKSEVKGSAAGEGKTAEKEKASTAEKASVESEKPSDSAKAEESEKPEEDKSDVNAKAENGSEKQEGAKKPEESKKSDEKPLEKMTVKELKEVAKDIPEITGVHGMNKPDLLSAIRKTRGIEEEPKKKKDVSLVDLKKKIKTLKVKRAEAILSKDKKMATIYKRKIAKLKKKTRRAA